MFQSPEGIAGLCAISRMTLVGEAETDLGAGADLRAGLATLGVSTSRLDTFWMSTLPPESMGTVMVALGSR